MFWWWGRIGGNGTFALLGLLYGILCIGDGGLLQSGFILGIKVKVLKRSSLGVGVGDAIRKIYSGAWIQYCLKILYAPKQTRGQRGIIWYISPST